MQALWEVSGSSPFAGTILKDLMRHGKFVRTALGYCCWMCDGPYSKWKKIQRRKLKRAEKRLVQRDVERQLEPE